MSLSEIFNEFPLLVPSIGAKIPKVFHGFINIDGADTEFYVTAPEFPSPKNVHVKTNIRVTTILQKHRDKIFQIEKESRNFLDYLKKLQQLVSEELSSEACSVRSNWLSAGQVDVLTRLLHDLDQLGWDNVTHVDPDFTYITLQEKDVRGRIHKMRLKIPPDYPTHAPCVEAQLPTEFDMNWNAGGGLNSVVTVWKQQLSSLQLFWDIMDELDNSALILDPPEPGPQHTQRRILLENHVSVQLNINVSHPRSMPHCHLLGSAQLVAPLNTKLTNSFQDWDPERSIIVNLENLLGVEVKKPKGSAEESTLATGEEEWSAECAVCYCLHLDEALPDHTCDHCMQPFHIKCLYDWLESLPNSRQSMNVIFGDCPYCTKAISCKVPT